MKSESQPTPAPATTRKRRRSRERPQACGGRQAKRPHARAGQHRGAIQRWVKRRIRSQRKEKKERGDAQDETKQLIQPPVIGRVKNASYKFHRQLYVARTANRRSCADTSPNARARQL